MVPSVCIRSYTPLILRFSESRKQNQAVGVFGVLVSWLAHSDSQGDSSVGWGPTGVVWPGLPRSRPLVPCAAPEESRQCTGLGHSIGSELGWLCGLWLATEEMEGGELE